MTALKAAGPILDSDRFFRDPEQVDSRFPPTFTNFTLESGGGLVACKLWQAAGPKAKGTVIINPPLGGGEAMNSNAIPLVNAGINVIIQRPRGVRDGNVVYSMANAMNDLHATINWIVDNGGTSKATRTGTPLRLDPTKIALLGMSGGGGNNGYGVVSESKHAHYAIAVNPGHPDYQLTPAMVQKMQPQYQAVRESTRGRQDWEKWLLDMTPAERSRISIIQNAPKLVDKHLLYIGGAYDSVSPIEVAMQPNIKALRGAGVKDLTTVIIDSDHGISNKRYTLARVVIGWLQSEGF